MSKYILPILGGGIIGGAIKLATSKAPKPLAPQPAATRDDAAAETARDDALRRRRGSAANMLLGEAGSASSSGTSMSAKALTGE
jgi:hypothetical protein